MAFPIGTVVLDVNSEGFLRFFTPAGVQLTTPTSNPQTGISGTGMISLTDGRLCIAGGGAPDFPISDCGIYADDFLSLIESPFPAGIGSASRSIARDDNGFWYGGGFNQGVGEGTIFKYNNLAALIDHYKVTVGIDDAFPIAVNGAGTIAYYTLDSDHLVVLAWDLVGDASLGTFASNAGYRCAIRTSLMCIGDDVFVAWDGIAGATPGYVRRYTAAGAFVQDYPTVGANSATMGLTPGVSSDSFWLTYGSSESSTYSGMTVTEFDILTGTILNTWDPEIGTENFNGAIAILGVTPLLTWLWTKVSGPGIVVFSDNTALDSTATFSAPGVYVLRLTATSSCQSLSDDVIITILSDCTLPGPDPVFDCG